VFVEYTANNAFDAGKSITRAHVQAHNSYLFTYDFYSPVRNALMQSNPLRGHMYNVHVHNSYLFTYDFYSPVLNALMQANPLRGSALKIETFLGPVKWHRAVRRVPSGAQKSQVLYDAM
jgi:hypothetical protein